MLSNITVLKYEIQGLPQDIGLPEMAMAFLQSSLLKGDDSYRLDKTWIFPEIN